MQLIFASKLQSSPIMGADMQYICLGSGKYKIIAKIYRDCKEAAFNNPNFYVYAGTNGSKACGVYSLSISRTGIRDVMPRCSTKNSGCCPSNTKSGRGIEEHTYEATVDFGNTPLKNFLSNSSCCEVTFVIGQCCRSNTITTGSSGNGFYASCMMNICNLKNATECNNSPKYTTPPLGYGCLNQSVYHNAGAVDSFENDSLNYFLVRGLRGIVDSFINNTGSYNHHYPLTPYCPTPGVVNCTPNSNAKPPRGFYFDTTTGNMIFTPSAQNEVGVIVSEIIERRKDSLGVWKIIGKTRRDLQFIVDDSCGYNNAPTLEVPKINVVNEGGKICFTIKSKDETLTPFQTIPDTTTLTWNKAIGAATFTIASSTAREKEAEFCWQTQLGDGKENAYSITVMASDNHCPKPIVSSLNFKIFVKQKATATKKITQLKCGVLKVEANISNKFIGTPSYSWNLYDSTLSKIIASSNKKTDSLKYNYGGKSILVFKINNQYDNASTYKDTLFLSPAPMLTIGKDTHICSGNNINLTAKTNYVKKPIQYYWTRPNNHILGDTNSNLFISNITKDSTIICSIKDSFSCMVHDTILIAHKSLPIANLGPDKRICTYEKITFNAGHNDTVNYLWNTGDTTQSILVNKKNNYTVKITDKKWNCSNFDTLTLFINDTVVSLAGKDATICTKDSISLIANHKNATLNAMYEWKNVNQTNFYSTQKVNKISPRNNLGDGEASMVYLYSLKTSIIESELLCFHTDTIAIKVNTNPKVKWANLTSRCFKDGDILLTSPTGGLVQFPPNNIMTSGKFRITSDSARLLDSVAPNIWYLRPKINPPNGSSYNIKLNISFSDSFGCKNSQASVQKINGNPFVQTLKKVYCQNQGEALMENSLIRPIFPVPTNLAKITWECISGPSTINTKNVLDNQLINNSWKFKFGAPHEDFYSGTYGFKVVVKYLITGCETADTNAVINIVREPYLGHIALPPQCANGDTLNLYDYFNLEGVKTKLGDGVISIGNGPHKNKKLINGYLFIKETKDSGVWTIKFKATNDNGCVNEDSFGLKIMSGINILKQNNFTICSNANPNHIENFAKIVYTYPPKNKTWNGNYINSRGIFTPALIGDSTHSRIINNMVLIEDSFGCKNTLTIPITIRNAPQIKIISPGYSCYDSVIAVTAQLKYNNYLLWKPIMGASGFFTHSQNLVTNYKPSNIDFNSGNVWLKASTVPLANDVCPVHSDSIKIVFVNNPKFVFTATGKGCEPLTITKFTCDEISGLPKNQLRYFWDFGNGNTSDDSMPKDITFPKTGKHSIQLTMANQISANFACTATQKLVDTVHVYPKPVVQFTTNPENSNTVVNPEFEMKNSSTLDTTIFKATLQFLWNFNSSNGNLLGSSTADNLSYTFPNNVENYTIKLTATSSLGCKDSSEKNVAIENDAVIFIPNIFSPNGKGPAENNVFKPNLRFYKNYEITIYARNGLKIFYSNDINNSWDGTYKNKNCANGVFIYLIKVTGTNDKTYKYRGTVTVTR